MEVQFGHETQSVDVKDGVFNVILGTVTPLNISFDKQYWLGISISGTELEPRVELTSSAYSLNAKTVEDSSITTEKIVDGAVTQNKLAAGVNLPPGGTAGGDLTGSYPNPTIKNNSINSSKIVNGSIGTDDISDGAITESKLATGLSIPPGGTAGGDLSGSFPNPTVTKINGRSVVNTAPTNGQVLRWDGTNWVPGDVEVSGWTDGGNKIYNTNLNDKVGIGINSPTAGLHVNNNDGVLFEGTFGSGTIPREGAGIRMMWFPNKAAFRVGNLTASGTDYWNEDNIGIYSVAMGIDTKASGDGSTAMGDNTTASGNNSTAIGDNTTASGVASTAMGIKTIASGDYSIAMGSKLIANGIYSTAMGTNVSTNGKAGTFVVGDASVTSINTSLSGPFSNDQMMMRFAGGYRLWSNSTYTTGVYMTGGTSGWVNISDRNKKENFTEIDGEELLNKIKNLPVTEWNYKNTDPSIKYVGPVAQDFYKAFHLGGKDSLGINSIAIDGINLAGVKALEKRTGEQEIKLKSQEKRIKGQDEKIKELEKQNAELRNQITEVSTKNLEIRSKNSELENRIAKIECIVKSEKYAEVVSTK